MRKPPPDEVVSAARRRLALLERELQQAGLTRLDDAPPPTTEVEPPDDGPLPGLPDPVVVRPAGRHAAPAPRRAPLRERLVGLVPDTLRGGVALDRGALVVVLVLALLGVGAAAYAVARDDGASSPAASAPVPDDGAPSAGQSGGETAAPLVDTGPAAAAPAASGAAASAAAASGAAAPTGTVTVHIAGKVVTPGVLQLPAGSRVVDAVDAAGGAKPKVDLSGLNLARVLVDGEQVLVGVAGPVPGAAAAAAEAAPPSGGSALVSLNTATLDQLDTLPGVGPVTAQKILDWREANGAFSAVEELLEVDGIGEKTLAEIAPNVTL